jgi:putative Holliday junction resolvase
MGIDYGEKRIGVALSDEGGGFAFAHGVVKNGKNAVKKIKKICEENKVGKVILGESVDYNGRPNPIMEEIKKFKKALEEETSLPAEYQKETLTTKEAERLQEGNKKIDASAAALILRSFLEREK